MSTEGCKKRNTDHKKRTLNKRLYFDNQLYDHTNPLSQYNEGNSLCVNVTSRGVVKYTSQSNFV